MQPCYLQLDVITVKPLPRLEMALHSRSSQGWWPQCRWGLLSPSQRSRVGQWWKGQGQPKVWTVGEVNGQAWTWLQPSSGDAQLIKGREGLRAGPSPELLAALFHTVAWSRPQLQWGFWTHGQCGDGEWGSRGRSSWPVGLIGAFTTLRHIDYSSC